MTTTPPRDDLWGSILRAASSKRSTPSRQILLLGDHNAGRSTVAAALLNKQLSSDPNDFALGYDWADVRDDADEDTLARLSIYTVPSPLPSYLSLVKHFLPPETYLPFTLAIILLDWTKPWSFVEQLQVWLSWLQSWATPSSTEKSRDVEIAKEEACDRLQYHIQHYAEPGLEASISTNQALNNTALPLGQGILTHPTGIPMIVVCTKADQIDQTADTAGRASSANIMVKGKTSEWEERTDIVMQVLRTICLQYGASLFYTTPQPTTLLSLRQYALHLLFMPPPPSTENPVVRNNPFPFNHKPNAIDRDRILIPAGWDSWGKIGVLRDGFNAKAWCDAWDYELDGDKESSDGQMSATAMFRSVVGSDLVDKVSKVQSLTLPTPEQTFLKEHWDENAKRPQDPRTQFRNPNEAPGANGISGVVGPMGSVSFQMPTVAGVLADIEGSVGGDGRKATRRDTMRTLGISPVPRSPVSPTFTSPGSGGGIGVSASGKVQTDVLQNFFQSLLQTNNRTGVRPSSALSGGSVGSADNS